jgi:hypothetical protein
VFEAAMQYAPPAQALDVVQFWVQIPVPDEGGL